VRDGNNYELLMNEKKIPQKQYRTDVIYYVLKTKIKKKHKKNIRDGIIMNERIYGMGIIMNF